MLTEHWRCGDGVRHDHVTKVVGVGYAVDAEPINVQSSDVIGQGQLNSVPRVRRQFLQA